MAEAAPAAKPVDVAVGDTWSAVRVRPLADGEAPLG
jgi:hypothetical protein